MKRTETTRRKQGGDREAGTFLEEQARRLWEHRTRKVRQEIRLYLSPYFGVCTPILPYSVSLLSMS